MQLRIPLIAALSLAFLLLACKKDTQFQVKTPANQAAPSGQANSSLPPGHPDIGQQMAQGQAQPGQPGTGTATGEIPPPPSAPSQGSVDLSGLEKSLPRGWKKVAPSSNMRLAQYKLPAAGGAADEAECAVFYFGTNAGSVEANIDRWYGQFSNQTDKKSSTATTAGKLKVTYVEVAGTMGGGMMGGNDAKTNYRLFGAIVEAPAGPYFFKAIGPEKTIKAQAEAMKSWLAKATANSVEQIEMH